MTSFIISTITTVLFSALAIVANYLMKALITDVIDPFSYDDFPKTSEAVALQKPNIANVMAKPDFPEAFYTAFDSFAATEYGKPLHYYNFTNRKSIQQFFYNVSKDQIEPYTVTLGFSIDSIEPAISEDGHAYSQINLTQFINKTDDKFVTTLTAEALTYRTLWRALLHEDIQFTVVNMQGHLMDLIFGQIGPILITIGMLSMIPMIISQPVLDINGEVRPFMISCTLTILPYWLATFVVDFLIWAGEATLVWVVFNAAQIQAFNDNMLLTWYVLVMSGPSIIISIYVLSFMFSSIGSATRQGFLVILVIVLVPIVIDAIRMADTPVWLETIYAFFPQVNLMRILSTICSKVGPLKESFGFYWTYDIALPDLILQFGNIFIYGAILLIIEARRDIITQRAAKKSFGEYSDFFKAEASRHPQSEEAILMAESVSNSHDFAVRIENVSRLFMNTAGKPIPAVNRINLGIKKGGIFGLLGANGAGKTTLIKMITSMLPPSDGTIEINGLDIMKHKDPTQLSVCPQFNTHLCDEMTPLEHFKMYSKLFQQEELDGLHRINKLISAMGLIDIKDKPIRECSSGDVRKLAIALSFLGPANIILLDEPTASLDPVARHHVHDMLLSMKGDKTFILCTHLLQEAESLCDMISIMIKGCLYTCGSPEYLSEKFGTEFKVDIMLNDDSEETVAKCDSFFMNELPKAQRTITRPIARIYSIPAEGITLPQLFVTMENGKEGDNGFNYYTCSSSSLERAFMEIVKISETNGVMEFQLP